MTSSIEDWPEDTNRPRDPRDADWADVRTLIDNLGRPEQLLAWYDAFQGELLDTTYMAIGREAFLERYYANTAVLFSGVEQRRRPGPRDDDSELRTTGRSRAGGGVDISDMVRVTLASQKVYVRLITEQSRALAIPDDRLIEALTYLDAWSAWSLKALITGHQEAALDAAAQQQQRQDRAMRQLLAGGLTPVELSRAAADCGLDVDSSYNVVRVPLDGVSTDDIRRELAEAGLVIGDVDGFTTLYGDAAMVVPSIPVGDVSFVVGVSLPVRVDSLAEGFRLATRCVEAAQLLGRTGFTTMEDLSIAAAIATDPDVVSILRARYIDPVASSGAAGEGILETVREYLDSERNVAATAKALFVHVNTVRYRIERFETITGCSLRDVQTMTEVWWVLQAREPAESHRL